MYCDNGSEFNNKLFIDRKTNGFRIQFTIDRRKAVYTERAIRTICRSLEQYYTGRPNESTANYRKIIKQLVKSYNNAPSTRAPKLPNRMNASLYEILHNDDLIVKMEEILKNR